MSSKILSLPILLLLLGCQLAPTKVYESNSPKTKDSQEIAVTEQTVFVDARPAFEYSVSHLNGAIPLRPEDFTQRETPFLGLLELDLFSLTRHIARLGIAPDSPVVVVGRGPEGKGEEGRVAWTLKYLGVKNVRYAAVSYFTRPLTASEAPPRPNATIWKPEVDESLVISRAEVIREIKKTHQVSEAPVIVDVRPSDEYLKPKAGTPDFGTINIPWTEFLTSKGLPKLEMKAKLEAIGVTANRKVILISNQGIESAAVTLVMRDLGYSKATNFSGGYLELLSKKF
jgi:thiosulfate/3-mercaptopyruvate sulfurtransferase